MYKKQQIDNTTTFEINMKKVNFLLYLNTWI